MSNVTKPIILDETGARIATALENMSGGIINDDAGVGVHNKTWSANKLETETDNIKDQITTLVLTPEMYGAKGDGVTDDSTAILSMFSHYAPTYVFNGNYICNSEIRLQNKKDFTIKGIGTIYKNSTASNSRLFDFLECENIHVEGITIKSKNDKTPDSPGSHSVRTGALLSNVHAFTIDNCTSITLSKVKFIQIGYCFSIGTWNTASSEEKYRVKNICMNDITMEDCGMGIYGEYISDLSINHWIFDDMAISPGGYHMFYGGTCLKNINLTNLAFNGNEYSDDVILVMSNQQNSANGDSNIIIENITAECSHFAATEPNISMIIKNAIIKMHNHVQENMSTGNSSIILTYYADTTAPNVVFDSCVISHVDGTEKPLIGINEINANLQFINCDIKMMLGEYAIHNVMFNKCRMSGRRLINTAQNTNFASSITFRECEVTAQGYSVIFNTTGKLIIDNCRFKTNHNRIIHSTAQAGSIYAYNNIVDSSYTGGGSVVFGLDSTYLTDYRDLNNTIYTS